METKLCPYCAEDIQMDAIKCKHCGEMLNKKNPTIQFVEIIFGITILVCFFLPWFDFAGLVSFSGAELPKAIVTLGKLFNNPGMNSSNMNLVFLIPVLSIVCIVVSFTKVRSKLIALLIAALFILASYLLLYMKEDAADVTLNVMGAGLYISILVAYLLCILYLITSLANIVKKYPDWNFLYVEIIILTVTILLLFGAVYPFYKTGEDKSNKIETVSESSGFSSSSDFQKYAKQDTEGENIIDFLSKFVSDKNFQLSRIKFPIGVYEHEIEEKDVNKYPKSKVTYDEAMLQYTYSEDITSENWFYLDKEDFNADKEEGLIVSWSDLKKNSVKFSKYIPNSGFLPINLEFRKTNGKWYLTSFFSISN